MNGSIELETTPLVGKLSKPDNLVGSLSEPANVKGVVNYGVVEKVINDYEKLENLPSINDVKLIGNKNSDEIGVLDVDDNITVKMVNDIWDAIFN